MNVTSPLVHAKDSSRCFFALKKHLRRHLHIPQLAALLLVGALYGGTAAHAQVVATQVTSAADVGRGQVVDVVVGWTRNATATGDKVTVPIPPQLAVNPPAPPAGCAYAASNMVCNVPDGNNGATGSITFQVQGAVLGGFNLTATGTSLPAATFSGTVRSTGDMVVGKAKTSPLGNPVAGGPVVFTLTPQITDGDDVPAGGSIVVTDNLPGTATDFSLTNVAFVRRTPSCNITANANSTRTLTCTYNGPFTPAELNGSRIILTGTAGNNGAFTNTALIASGSTEYFDSNPANNTVTVDYTVDPGTDIEALGTFPSAGQIVGTSQTLVLTHRNNGPLASPAGGLVQTIVPATFALGTLPAGCTAAPGSGSLTVSGTTYNGRLVSCNVGALAVNGAQSFSLPLTLPAAPEASSFPVVVTPPLGRGDANAGNNQTLLPYQIVNPYADLRAVKSKSVDGPRAPGTSVTTTLTIRNEASSPSAATYDAAHPLRIVDYTRPEEVAGGTITVSPASIAAGWSCSVTLNIVPPAFIEDANKTTRIACVNSGPGILAPNATATVSFSSTIDNVTEPIALTDRACTGTRALEALGLTAADGPQPSDGGRTGNDCADAGSGLVATPVTSGKAVVSIKKESSVDGTNFFDPVAAAPTLVGNAGTLYWKMTITTPSAGANPDQETIPTLKLTDTLPGIMQVNTTGAPAPDFRTPAITVTTTPSTWGSCPNISSGNGGLTCEFKNVPPGETIAVLVPVQRPLTSGSLVNTATLTSPDAILSAPAGGQLSDDAAVVVTPRTDVALTTKVVTPATPLVGQIVLFAITAQNLGEDNIAVGHFTITDNLFTGTPTLTTPAYEVIDVQPANAAQMTCAASNLATGAIACTNSAVINRYNTQTINIRARIKKPTGIGGAAGDKLYFSVPNTARVTLGGGMCEFRTETSTLPASVSASCGDAAATSNNEKTINFDVKVPAIDLQQGKVPVYPAGQTQFLIGDQLRYRFSVRNFGPSRAENIVMNDILAVAPGFQVAMAAAMPANINGVPASTGYTPVSKAVSCTQAGPNANVVCNIDHLDAGQEVNFEVAMDMTGIASGPVVFGNKVYVCADETNVYESSGKCSDDPAEAGNNLAAVNDVVFPKTDLEVVSKTAVTPSPVDIAQPIEYDIVLRNNGTSATTKLRLVDTLPTGFEWINGGVHAPRVAVNGGSAATLTAAGGALTVSGSVPTNGTENVCFVSNGITNLTTLAQRQAITCDISGAFPPGAANTITLKLYARAKPGLYDGSAAAPYLTDRTNLARIYPGKDDKGENISVDDNPNNNEKSTTVQVHKAQVGGRVFVDLNDNGDQDGTIPSADQGIGNVELTLTGTDKYGNTVTRTVSTSNVAAGNGSSRGDYLFDNLPPSDAHGYTITQTQPAGFGNGKPQPNTIRPIRNVDSTGVTNKGTANNPDANFSVISGIVIEGGGNGVQFDFPELTTDTSTNLKISGYAYLDANNNGIFDGGETPLPGVTITLVGCSAGPDNRIDTGSVDTSQPAVCSGDDLPVSFTTTTDANGFYNFPLEKPGRYTVIQQAAQPVVDGVETLKGKTTAGSVDKTGSAAGANDGGTSGTATTVLGEINNALPSSISNILIDDSTAQSVNNNFGEVLPGSISGFVYTEKGAHGSNFDPDTDWPFTGVKVKLTGRDDLGNPVDVEVTTQADGSYRFDNLRPSGPGGYTVKKTNPDRPADPVRNENPGSYPGVEAGVGATGSSPGARNGDETVAGVVVVSGSVIEQTNFAVLNGTRVELALAKRHVGDVIVGQEASYELIIINKGDSPTFGAIQMADTLPPGMSLVATDPITSTMGAISNVVVVDQTVRFDFMPTTPLPITSGTATVLVKVDVTELAQGDDVINYATVTGGGDPYVPPATPGPNCTDQHCAEDKVKVYGPPVLALAKTGPATLYLGGTDEYTLTITNSGEAATIGALRLVEHLPPGLDLNTDPQAGVDLDKTLVSSDGTISNIVRSGDIASGVIVTFDFDPTTPLAAANGTADIQVMVKIDVSTPIGVSTNHASVGGGGDLRGDPPTPGSNCTDTRCANVPANVEGAGLLSIVKTANKRDAELGDMVTYTLEISNISQAFVVRPNIVDRLPQGFRLIENTTRVRGATLVETKGAPGPVITYSLDQIAPGAKVTITYRVRLGVGSMQGDGVNRASAECPLNPNTKCSNEARWRVKVSGGVFTDDACIVGMVYVDCNGNQIKDKEELGIPGVRMYAENGLFLISDSEGKYSYCGFSPKTHVLKVDSTTLPRGSRLVVSSNRNVGDANSLFLDLKKGELQRADFIEGSCSNTVLEQVKARRTQGEVSAPHVEKKGGVGFTFEGKAANYPQQGTDSANQVIVKPRMDSREAIEKAVPAETVSERDTPLRQLEINQGGRDAR